MGARRDGALSASRVMLAAVSTKAVVCRLGGFVQPGETVEEQDNILLVTLYITVSPAGVPRQDFGVHFMLC